MEASTRMNTDYVYLIQLSLCKRGKNNGVCDDSRENIHDVRGKNEREKNSNTGKAKQDAVVPVQTHGQEDKNIRQREREKRDKKGTQQMKNRRQR